MKTLIKTIILATMLYPVTLIADSAQKKATVPPPPVIPGESEGQQQRIEADVVIRKYKNKVVEEYRVNGSLYMVKITPKVGKPYYLRYPDGESGPAIRHELRDINTPYWKLFEW